ncbi:alpha/beta hydrolase [Winogradskya consettensis]|uniref:Alpha/beta hydrolase n=1 Tax=Winogradskya consettensis TaxID=113560 RepID=A0A919SDP3_9ACTN|nr:alpha/beta hydrolase [Actinoplanes consettensis]GIM70740.1 alpha/beta hydrolase [Actinoplanes consettensis]
MSTVTSADGTRIGFETSGSGPAVILVDGAMTHRGFGPSGDLAVALSDAFTVYRYDRRGRGESGDTAPYEPRREVEDLAALLQAAGGSAALVGVSSGAVLAADAANALPGVTKLALYEPPFIVDGTHAPRPDAFLPEMEALVAAGDTGGAVKKFLRSVGMPGFAVTIMSVLPPFRKMRATAPTLPYDLRVLGDTGRGQPLDPSRWARVTAPALVLDGGKSPQYMRNAAAALSAALPGAQYRTLPGQTHIVKASVLAPAVKEFL